MHRSGVSPKNPASETRKFGRLTTGLVRIKKGGSSMKKYVLGLCCAASLLFAGTSSSYAKGIGTSGGLTLLEAPGARASALGQTLTSAVDDVSAFAYNPSMLKTLTAGQASFLYQQGLIDDSYGQFLIGSPYKQLGLGLSIGYYNGGNFQRSDDGGQRTANAERDLSLALGMARSVGPLSIGVTGKYLTSQLAETARASAFAADLGLNFSASPRLNMGGALQNIGTQLKYDSTGDNLPRIFRLGASYSIFPQYGTTLMIDVERLMNEGETRPGLGLETLVGPLAFRAGYRHSSGAKEVTIGTGFAWARQSFDYSFGLVNQGLKTQQKISYSFRFGGTGDGIKLFGQKGPSDGAVARAPITAPANLRFGMAPSGQPSTPTSPSIARPAVRAPLNPASFSKTATRRMYQIKPGDTLTKIAENIYGDKRMWRTIYMANKYLLDSPTALEVGQKIALP